MTEIGIVVLLLRKRISRRALLLLLQYPINMDMRQWLTMYAYIKCVHYCDSNDIICTRAIISRRAYRKSPSRVTRRQRARVTWRRCAPRRRRWPSCRCRCRAPSPTAAAPPPRRRSRPLLCSLISKF